MRTGLALLLGVLSLMGPSALNAASPHKYEVGQVWEYKTREGDEGSLLKIQQIEDLAGMKNLGPVYHISVVGIRFSNVQVPPMLPHAPVSRATLDASVLRLSQSQQAFPDYAEGVSVWRGAKGGVFTIPVSNIVELIDKQTADLR